MFGVRLERREEEATDKPDYWDVLRLRALQMVTQVLCVISFKTRVGHVVVEEEVGQMLNLLIVASGNHSDHIRVLVHLHPHASPAEEEPCD
jgi:hypothetical protein